MAVEALRGGEPEVITREAVKRNLSLDLVKKRVSDGRSRFRRT